MIFVEPCRPMAPFAIPPCGVAGYTWVCEEHGLRGWAPPDESGVTHAFHAETDAETAEGAHLAEAH